MEEPILDVSPTWTHTSWGLLCLAPSLSVGDSGSDPGAACGLLAPARGPETFPCVADASCTSIHPWMDTWRLL
ncbi:hypothetical protein VULLAG_LOCUS3234 [Vulpes lagopus]